jgi:hypothetical protein
MVTCFCASVEADTRPRPRKFRHFLCQEGGVGSWLVGGVHDGIVEWREACRGVEWRLRELMS